MNNECCCPHWDDVECLAIRYGLDAEDVHEGDMCECSCHDKDPEAEEEWEL